MLLSKRCLSRTDLLAGGISRFRSHFYKVRHQCIRMLYKCLRTMYDIIDKRSSINFPGERTKEYCGRHLVGYSMDQVYDVVSDVENYHTFLPWCKKSTVMNKTCDSLQADLFIGVPPINECYTSVVTLRKPHSVKAESEEGKLFRHLITMWTFSPGLKKEQQSCVVDFQITFTFRSIIYAQLLNLIFDRAAQEVEDAFMKEVERRHGPATIQRKNLTNSKDDLDS